jgi:hypothetical protein
MASEWSVAVGSARILVASEPPSMVGVFQQHVELLEDFADDGGYFFVAVADDEEWPSLVVSQRYGSFTPAFAPGALIEGPPSCP